MRPDMSSETRDTATSARDEERPLAGKPEDVPTETGAGGRVAGVGGKDAGVGGRVAGAGVNAWVGLGASHAANKIAGVRRSGAAG
jgi:hypothetical protein